MRFVASIFSRLCTKWVLVVASRRKEVRHDYDNSSYEWATSYLRARTTVRDPCTVVLAGIVVVSYSRLSVSRVADIVNDVIRPAVNHDLTLNY